VDNLFARLSEFGLTLVLARPPHDPDTLLLRGESKWKTPEIIAALKTHKAEIVKRLRPPAVMPEKPKPSLVTAEIEAECHECRALICFPAGAEGVFCERAANCPQTRLGTVPKAESRRQWKW